jgi:hypothetical protein
MRRHASNNTKTDIPVPIVGIVPVAVRTTQIPIFIVERAPAQHPRLLPASPIESKTSEVFKTSEV